ncbi:MAG: DUF547 domain-containing protein [Fibrobacteres bacterium]|nr:DUF547 domain-containing protein [Fibrobacterota bacterium]
MSSPAALMALVFSSGVYETTTEQWNHLLRDHVGFRPDGRTAVHYSAVVADSARVRRVAKEFGEVSTDSFARWTLPRQKSFLINAYNLSIWSFVTSHWPLDSLEGTPLGRRVWKQESIALLGKRRSFDWIEDRLRKLGDARIHFALNCGAKSCPPLRREAYADTALEQQLNQQATRFVATDCPEPISPSDSCSALFSWYRSDLLSDTTLAHLLMDSGMKSGIPMLTKLRPRTYFQRLDDLKEP